MTQSHKTLIILDWDDTLFPTSWVMDNSIDLADPSTRMKYNEVFKELDELLSSFLAKTNSLGTTLIITNAMPEWVQLSSSLLRKTNKILKNIEVISARERYRNRQMKDWKKHCFLDEIKKYGHEIDNIVSIGDATYEYIALVNLYNHQKRYYDRLLKAVKLQRYPSYDHLHEQLSMMNNNISKICRHKNHLDLQFNQI